MATAMPMDFCICWDSSTPVLVSIVMVSLIIRMHLTLERLQISALLLSV